MALDKQGNHIKGTKKALPEGWVTYGFRYALKPSKNQAQQLEMAFGSERKVYNEYVAGFYEHLETIGFEGGFVSYTAPAYKTITARFPFLDGANDAFVYNDAKMRFSAAIKKYNESFAKKPLQYKKSVRKKMKDGYVPSLYDIKGLPKFHSKKQGKFSYTTNQTNHNIRLEERDGKNFLRIPKFRDGIPIHLHRAIPENGQIKKATIRREGSTYLVSLSIDYPLERMPLIQHVTEAKVVGLDYSQSDLYVDSNGSKAQYPRFHKLIEKRQRRQNKSLARKRKRADKTEDGAMVPSNNYRKQLKKYQQTMAKAKNQRKDFLHKKSNRITNDYDAIVVEDLDLTNLSQCLSLGKKLHDNGFGMFRNMLLYKTEKKGKHLILADKYFPSSKLCSCCGHKKKSLRLSERTYVCKSCHTKIDRDYNAGKNLKQYGIRILAQLGTLEKPASL